MKVLAALIACLTVGCASPMTAPSPAPVVVATVAPPPPAPKVWGLSGQSNANRLREPLSAYATIIGVQQDSQYLAAWNEDQPLWRDLREALTAQKPDCFIWWQGEADAAYGDPSTYGERLRVFLDRVRGVTRSDLPVLIIGLADIALPQYQARYATVRAGQQALVASDPRDRYLSAEGLPTRTDEPFHLTPEGYVQMAARINDLLAR